ncbi:CCA tRNA nucleotidyltransferase [Allofustis seminis]|uniref:CCA tRNA nucleotidyltransferase n=1 Tax=Allofustis seminis TaxID=166939 RepID=UPI0003631070|nr:CCA tRNA nucleotidyltransferase [Allofustis seminis]
MKEHERKIKLSKIFLEALPVIDEIQKAGHEAYFVGGSIRDTLLDLPVNDVDIATSATPEEVKSIFKHTIDIGIEHGTIMVLWKGQPYEVTTFRTESTYADYRRPDTVTFVRSLKEDLKRRDFTMNAMAMSANGVLIDYFNGKDAIENKRIETVGLARERFNEDALRMMRAVRFQAQLGFELANETFQAIKKFAPLLEKIAVERVRIEFEKLLCGKWRSLGIQTMIQTDLYQYCPEIANKKYELLQLAKTDKMVHSDTEAWALLSYFLQYNDDTFCAKSFLRNWKLSNRLIDEVDTILKGIASRPATPEEDSWYLFSVGLQALESIEKIRAIIGEPSHLNDVREAYQQLPITHPQQLAITGNDLLQYFDKKPGPWIGQKLHQALHHVVIGQVANQKHEILKDLLK